MNPRCLPCFMLCLVLLSFIPGIRPAQAQAVPPPVASNAGLDSAALELAGLLRPDGSLNNLSNLSGSFTLGGWRMVLDDTGEPHFFPPQNAPADHPDDPFWSRSFMLGVENLGLGNSTSVFAIAVMEGGKVFVGGEFSASGGIPTANIACWDSLQNRWQALGTGVNNSVKALAVYGSYLYVGGVFTQAGGDSVGPLARWDENSQTWSSIGSLEQSQGSPSVSALEIGASGALYAGGNFTSVDGIPATNIAVLDSIGWHALGSGISSGTPQAASVFAMDLYPPLGLYVGGTFTTAGGIPASNLARWDGSSWHTVGGGLGGLNARVNAIAARPDNTVYAGGFFSEAYDGLGGTLYVSNIARWSGAAWSDLDGGVNSDVFALQNLGAWLLVAGRFSTAGDSTAHNLAAWDGAFWTTVKDPLEHGNGTDGDVYTIALTPNYVVIGGAFEHAGEHVAHHVAALDRSLVKWVAMGGSVNATVYTLAIADGYVYAGGTFSTASNLFQAFVGRWSIAEQAWHPVGNGDAISGCNGSFCVPAVRALAVDGDDLYIGGNFSRIGNLTVNGIARFNSSAQYGWHALGSGVGCTPAGCIPSVRAIAVSGGSVYAGGSFSSAGGAPANNVAVWNSSTWSALLNGTNERVYALEPVVGGIVTGGNFTTPENYIALWNGSSWAPVGNGVDGTVYAIASGGSLDSLYIGGAFTNIAHIARLSGASWQALGSGLNGTVNALALDEYGEIYAGGNFSASAGTNLDNVAHWNGQTWSPLGSGTNGTVNALEVTGRRVMAGGAFSRAGGYPSFFLGSFNKVPIYLPVIGR